MTRQVSEARGVVWAAMLGGLLVSGWGCGRGDPPPVVEKRSVQALAQPAGLAAGAWQSLRLSPCGDVWAWGDNSNGQLGDGTTLGRYLPAAVSLPGPASRLAAAGQHSLAIYNPEGLASAWGLNVHGQLGNGESGYSPSPVPVPLP